MKHNLALTSIAALLIAGCTSLPAAENAANLSVDVSWTADSRCSRTSPPIKVGNIPAGTKYLKVRMVDLNLPSYNHGGGEVEYSGNGTISEGALKSFKGPCPPGETHNYEITVQAINADKSLMLGQGKTTRPYPDR